ncbi:MAG: hypothetical protein U5L95_04600 [Candidatus Saccharibacteria bacterium]|nr:hypothetical protein [Candidatus Saccharibacteria bacterium]
MADKRKLHHFYTKLRKLNPKVLLLLFLVCGVLSAVGLRSNNVRMLELRQEVFAADKKGEEVGRALDELRRYVHGHMNTDLNSGGLSIKPPIQLKHTYERLVSKEQQRVKEHNDEVISTAQTRCEQRFPAGQIRARAACVDDYIAENTVEAKPVPKELYRFDFASPTWSPDFAGIMILVTTLLGALLAIRLLLGAFIKHEIK